ncbi:MAG: hypothetical protein ACYTFY_13540 [Planctomycetota bacterium]|jgi:hypothetical protein
MMDTFHYLEKLDKLFNTHEAADIVHRLDNAAHYDCDESGWIAMSYQDTEDWPDIPWREVIDEGWRDKYLLWILRRMYREAKNPYFLTLFSIPAGHALWESMFGAELDYEKGGVWAHRLEGITIDELIDQGVPDVAAAGIAPLVLDTSRFFLDKLARYENLSKLSVCAIEHHSIFEISMSLLGQTLMEDMVLRPEVVKKFFDIVQETMVRYFLLIQEQFKVEIEQNRMYMFKRPFSHYNSFRIIEDSAIMLSPDLYNTFCRPYNEFFFERFAPGEGYLHFCGDGNNIMDAVLETKGLRGLHPGQAEFYNIEQLYPKLSEKKVAIQFTRLSEWSDNDVKEITNSRPGVIVLG